MKNKYQMKNLEMLPLQQTEIMFLVLKWLKIWNEYIYI